MYGAGKLPELGIGLKSNGYSSSPSSSVDMNSLAGAEQQHCMVREQDRFMPIANVIRIMRRILPAHAKISDDAKETMQECVSEFISFITGEANERCQREQRKTITAEDVLWAMSKLGFDDYIEPLTMFLHRHRQIDGADKGSFKAPAPAAGDHFPAPPLPLSPTAPPLFGRHHPPTGFFIPTPATPGNGYSSTAAASSNNHGTPSSSAQNEVSGNE